MTMMKKRAKEMDHLNRPRILGTSMKKFAVREWVSRGDGFGGRGVYRYGDLHCSASLDVAPYFFFGKRSVSRYVIDSCEEMSHVFEEEEEEEELIHEKDRLTHVILISNI